MPAPYLDENDWQGLRQTLDELWDREQATSRVGVYAGRWGNTGYGGGTGAPSHFSWNDEQHTPPPHLFKRGNNGGTYQSVDIVAGGLYFIIANLLTSGAGVDVRQDVEIRINGTAKVHSLGGGEGSAGTYVKHTLSHLQALAAGDFIQATFVGPTGSQFVSTPWSNLTVVRLADWPR